MQKMRVVAMLGCGAAFLLSSGARAQESSAPKASETSKASHLGSKDPAAAQKTISELLEKKIRAMWKAFKEKDKTAYAEYLADDFMAVEEDGQGERTKAVVVREVGESMLHDYNVQLFRVDAIGPNAQFVTYENVLQFPPGSAARFQKIFISEVWVKRGGEWKSWRYQATRVK